MWKRRFIASIVTVGMFAIPVVALAKTEAPGGVRHTIEVHGQYQGCKWTGGWAQRVWKHTGTEPGPEADPNYPGKLWDFRCKLPIVPATVTVTQTVSVPVPPATVTVTVTPSQTPSPSPSCEPEVRNDDDEECGED